MANIPGPFGSQAQPIVVSSPTQRVYWDEVIRVISPIGDREATPSQRESLHGLPRVPTDFSLDSPEPPTIQDSQENTARRATPSPTRDEESPSSSGAETPSSEDSDDFEELTLGVEQKLRQLKQNHQRLGQTTAKHAVIHRRQRAAYANEHQTLYQSIEQLQSCLDEKTTVHSKLLSEHRKLLVWQIRHQSKEARLRTRVKELKIQQELLLERQPPNCPICYDNKCGAETRCGHQFCWPCLIAWYDSQKDQGLEHSCPSCRALLAGKDHSAGALASQLRWQ